MWARSPLGEEVSLRCGGPALGKPISGRRFHRGCLCFPCIAHLHLSTACGYRNRRLRRRFSALLHQVKPYKRSSPGRKHHDYASAPAVSRIHGARQSRLRECVHAWSFSPDPGTEHMLVALARSLGQHVTNSPVGFWCQMDAGGHTERAGRSIDIDSVTGAYLSPCRRMHALYGRENPAATTLARCPVPLMRGHGPWTTWSETDAARD
nr:unnamed protein product [Digitaria exilis]